MSIQVLRPENLLGKLLRAAGGLKIKDALAAAEENLKELEAPATAELQANLVEAEQIFAGYGRSFDEAKHDALYALANRAIGLAELCGLPAVDQALISLCELLDRLRMRHGWDAEAVGVHIHALRALLHASPGDQQVAAILAGLKMVSAREPSGPAI